MLPKNHLLIHTKLSDQKPIGGRLRKFLFLIIIIYVVDNEVDNQSENMLIASTPLV